MKNAETWKVANTYASNFLLYIALGLNFLQAIVFFIWPSQTGFLVVAGFMVLAIVAIIPLTEAHLRKYFKDEFR